jgi:hypothetical protein
MESTPYQHKKVAAFFLFVIYLGCIAIAAQDIPKTYVAHQTKENIIVDGNSNENVWTNVEWSEVFQDIEGDKPAKYETRIKMAWDTTNLYFFTEIKEPHVWATLKQRDTVIFYNNDFEIFIDPDGDTHNYYELEVNALNTIWDLYLSKPYRNGNQVLNDWDFKGLKSAVKINGTLNNPKDIDEGWNVEIAIPWASISSSGGHINIPKNDFWRINFSRVNWDYDLIDNRYSRKKGPDDNYLKEYNWVWSPQGVINMHEPERWGYVYFSTDTSAKKNNFKIPEDEHIKWYLYQLYRDCRDKKNSVWEQDENQLITSKTILGKSVNVILEINSFGFDIWTISPFTGKKLIVHNDGKFESSTKNR